MCGQFTATDQFHLHYLDWCLGHDGYSVNICCGNRGEERVGAGGLHIQKEEQEDGAWRQLVGRSGDHSVFFIADPSNGL